MAFAALLALTLPVAVRADEHKDFTLVERAASDTVTDLGATGDSVGDILTFANDVYDQDNARKVGTDNGACVRTVAGQTWQCSVTTTLEDGQIMVAGPYHDGADSVLAVTGGTGRYARARGEMTLHARDAKGNAFDLGFRLKD